MKLVSCAVFVLVFILSGCTEKSVDPPKDKDVSASIASLYSQVGLATSISEHTIIGKHYNPGMDSWMLIACVNFSLPDKSKVRDCNDSFNLLLLDSGGWVVNGRINGQ